MGGTGGGGKAVWMWAWLERGGVLLQSPRSRQDKTGAGLWKGGAANRGPGREQEGAPGSSSPSRCPHLLICHSSVLWGRVLTPNM